MTAPAVGTGSSAFLLHSYSQMEAGLATVLNAAQSHDIRIAATEGSLTIMDDHIVTVSAMQHQLANNQAQLDADLVATDTDVLTNTDRIDRVHTLAKKVEGDTVLQGEEIFQLQVEMKSLENTSRCSRTSRPMSTHSKRRCRC